MRLGVDLVLLSELDRLATRGWFTRFAFAATEMETAMSLAGDRRREFLAGRFAAKEAVLKVLGTGLFAGVMPSEIALARSGSGAPEVELTGGARRTAESLGIRAVTVSITHKRDMAIAVAMGLETAAMGL